MFHIKICGVRTPDDVDAVIASEADAIGLNFFPASVRYADPQAAVTIGLSAQAQQAGLIRVGVFVNENARHVAKIASDVKLDAVQLHGDEDPASVKEIKELTGLPVIRAIKLPLGELLPESIDQLARPWIEMNAHLLLDADAGAAHGGSGKSIDWRAVHEWSGENVGVHWTLAGGLNSGNVAEAIAVSGATSVDTASGVESERGKKSSKLIAGFARAAQQAMNLG